MEKNTLEMRAAKSALIQEIDEKLDHVCESNNYTLYSLIEKEIDDDLSGFKWFDLDKLTKVKELLDSNDIESKPVIPNDIDSIEKEKKGSKKEHILSIYKTGLSVSDLVKMTGYPYATCRHAIKDLI